MTLLHCALRTTDLIDAHRFYAAALDLELRRDGAWPQLVALPAPAAAAGAPAHWVGFVAVDDVTAALARLGPLGFAPLGPPGADRAVLRDPSGAVIGVATGTPPPPPVARLDHASTDVERAAAAYAAGFGWAPTTLVADGPLRVAAVALGALTAHFTDAGRRPEVHPHWALGFTVDDLERAGARIAAAGGEVVGAPLVTPTGRLAYCHDPQGAAFTVVERAGAA